MGQDIGDLMDKEQFPDRYVMLDGTTAATKSDVRKLRSRRPMAVEVVIVGTATVRLFASNIETEKNGTKWGAHLREFTASQKVIIEGEPWVNWMFEHVSGSGTVYAAVGV
jgi:hypothetical protein